MADKCPACGLGTVMSDENLASNPIILDQVRFRLNDLLTTSQTCFVCRMLYEGVLLLPNFQEVEEFEVNKSAGALTPLEVTCRQPGKKSGHTYEFYIPTSMLYLEPFVDMHRQR
jgi:hypothetical protein